MFDNATGQTKPLGETSSLSTTVSAPSGLPAAPGVYIKVQLRSVGAPNPSWEQPVDAYFRMVDGAWRLIGFERMPHA